MGALSPILRSVEGGQVGFYCPGCKGAHVIPVDTGPKRPNAWTWNGDANAPTFQPSILVTTGRAVDPTYQPDPDFPDPPEVCHSFVTNGQIQFLGDCTHALAGQTVPIPPWPADYGGME